MTQIPLFQTPLSQRPSLSVTELTRYLKTLLEMDDLLSDVWVQGEISNFSHPSSGHLYFTLKDGGAALKCVVWRSTAIRLRFAMQNGLAVEAHGAISIYERDGAYQLYVDAVRPAGEGRLYQEFLLLKSRLEAEGLFDEERKRPLPERPQCIGIVTSPTGAALQDMLNTLRARYPLAEVVISPCSVQGEAAPEEIVEALRCLSRSNRPDVIIMARGGGSLEDLWAFNDERVVRAIVASPIPVITGIGHETDFTLSDFAADVRAPTPTGAAVLCTPNRADMKSELLGVQSRLESAVMAGTSRRWQDVDTLRQRMAYASPERQIQAAKQHIADLRSRQERSFGHLLQLQRARMDGLHSRLAALNPTAVLQRGYALVQRPDGSLVKTAAGVTSGETIHVQMQDGKLITRVEQVQPAKGK